MTQPCFKHVTIRPLKGPSSVKWRERSYLKLLGSAKATGPIHLMFETLKEFQPIPSALRSEVPASRYPLKPPSHPWCRPTCTSSQGDGKVNAETMRNCKSLEFSGKNMANWLPFSKSLQFTHGKSKSLGKPHGKTHECRKSVCNPKDFTWRNRESIEVAWFLQIQFNFEECNSFHGTIPIVIIVMCSQAILTMLRHDNFAMLGDFTLEYHYELGQIAIIHPFHCCFRAGNSINFSWWGQSQLHELASTEASSMPGLQELWNNLSFTLW